MSSECVGTDRNTQVRGGERGARDGLRLRLSEPTLGSRPPHGPPGPRHNLALQGLQGLSDDQEHSQPVSIHPQPTAHHQRPLALLPSMLFMNHVKSLSHGRWRELRDLTRSPRLSSLAGR